MPEAILSASPPTLGPYDTKLPPAEEQKFQTWKAKNAPTDSGADYDLRGAYKAGLNPAANGHWPDTYKKPNHPTFSNESIYATSDAPRWQGNVLVDKSGKIVADESGASPTAKVAPMAEPTITPAPPAAPQWESLSADHGVATGSAMPPAAPQWESLSGDHGVKSGTLPPPATDRMALSSGTIKPEDTMNPGANQWLKEHYPRVYSGLESILTLPDRGIEQLGRAAAPGRSKAERTADAIEGASTLASPLLLTVPGSGHVASVATGLGAAALAQPAASKLAEKAGASPTTQRAVGDVAGLAAGIGGGAVVGALRGAGTANPFALNRTNVESTAVKALNPPAADSNFIDVARPVRDDIATHGGRVITSNEDLIPAAQKAIAHHQDALEAWMDRGRQQGLTIPTQALVDATRQAIPRTMIREDPAGAASIIKQAEDAYGNGSTETVDGLRQIIKEKNAELKSFYDQKTGKQTATIIAGKPMAMIEAQIAAARDALYNALDPENGGAGPREIQRRTGEIMNWRDLATNNRNSVTGEKPVTPLAGAGKSAAALAELVGAPFRGDIVGSLNKVRHPIKGPTDVHIKRLFSDFDQAEPLPMPPPTAATAPPAGTPPPVGTEPPPVGTEPPPVASRPPISPANEVQQAMEGAAQDLYKKRFDDLKPDERTNVINEAAKQLRMTVQSPTEVSAEGPEQPVQEAAKAAGQIAANPPEAKPATMASNAPAAQESGPGASGEGRPVQEPVRAGGESAPAPQSSRTVVKIPGEPGGYQADYEVRELADVQGSHNGLTFQPNPKFEHINERDYGNPENQGKILSGSSEALFDPAYHVTDNPDAVNGPLVTDANLNVLGGNGRKAILDRVYAYSKKGADAYRALLMKKAAQFGIDPKTVEGMKQPVLIRRIADSEFENAAEKQDVVGKLNRVGTQVLTPAERAIADSRRVSPATLESIAGRLEDAGEGAGLADVLKGRDGTAILNKLIEDGVVPANERAGLAKGDELTPAGKDRITKLMLGRFFRDPAQLDNIAPSIKNKLGRVMAPLARLEANEPWSLTPKIQEAMDLLEEARSRGVKNIDDVLNQKGLLGDQAYSPDAVALAKTLQKGDAGRLKEAFGNYADKAAYAAQYQGPGMFNEFPPPSEPGPAFQEALTTANQKPAPKAAKPPESMPAAMLQRSLGPPTPGMTQDLFGSQTGELSEAQAHAEAAAKEKLSGDQLAAEFNSPISAANRRTKLKPGAKPVQESMFGKPTEPPPQTDFDFQKELVDKGVKQDFSQPFDPKDQGGSLMRSTYRVYPETDKLPARFYVDETGAALFQHIMEEVEGRKFPAGGSVKGMQINTNVVPHMLTELAKKPMLPEMRAKLTDMAKDLENAYISNSKGVMIVRAKSGTPIADIKGTVYHEAAHQAQDVVAGPRMQALFHYDTQVADIPNYAKAVRELERRGYDPAKKDVMVKEILSSAATNGYNPGTGLNEVGLTRSQMADTVASIMDKAVAARGENAYALISHASPSFRATVMSKMKAATAAGAAK